MMIAAYRDNTGPEDDPGTTSTVAALLCFGIGAMVWYGDALIATMLTLAITALLYFKTELHGVTQQLTRRDLVSFLQFAVIAFVLLPVLPDHGYGPYGALNPHQIGMMVVVVSGVSLAGYAALRIGAQRRGLILIGVLGGLVSSTATTLVFARHARAKTATVEIAAVVILLANLIVFVRLAVLAAVFGSKLLPYLLPAFVAAALLGCLVPYRLWRRLKRDESAPPLEVSNPTELPIAIGAGLTFALILLASSWLSEHVGTAGLYAASAVFGLTDLDAITLSTLRLLKLEQIGVQQAGIAVVVAYCANMLLKLGFAWGFGSTGLMRRVVPGFALVLAGLLPVAIFTAWLMKGA